MKMEQVEETGSFDTNLRDVKVCGFKVFFVSESVYRLYAMAGPHSVKKTKMYDGHLRLAGCVLIEVEKPPLLLYFKVEILPAPEGNLLELCTDLGSLTK